MFHMVNQYWRNTPKEKITTPPHIPSMDCHLAVVEGLVRFNDPENSAGRGMWASGRYNQAGKIDGEKPDQKAVNILSLRLFLWEKFFPCAFHITFLHYNETYYKLLNFSQEQISHYFIKIWNALKNVKM